MARFGFGHHDIPDGSLRGTAATSSHHSDRGDGRQSEGTKEEIKAFTALVGGAHSPQSNNIVTEHVDGGVSFQIHHRALYGRSVRSSNQRLDGLADGQQEPAVFAASVLLLSYECSTKTLGGTDRHSEQT